MTEDIFIGKPEESADARPMTRAEKAVRVANIALHYIAGTHGLQEWRGKEQATEALAKMTDILGTPPENDPDMTIESLRHRIGVLEKSIRLQEEQYKNVVQERTDWRKKYQELEGQYRTVVSARAVLMQERLNDSARIGELEAERDRWKASVHEVQGRLDDAVRQADAATNQSCIQIDLHKALIAQRIEDEKYIKKLEETLSLHIAFDALKAALVKSLKRKGKKKDEKSTADRE